MVPIPYVEVIISLMGAIFGGGALIKLIDVISKRSKFVVQVSGDEKKNLRQDVMALRSEINELRYEVVELRKEVIKRQVEITNWTTKFFALKIAVDKIVIYLNSLGSLDEDKRLDGLLQEAIDIMEDDDGII